jgi:hypothetical protein
MEAMRTVIQLFMESAEDEEDDGDGEGAAPEDPTPASISALSPPRGVAGTSAATAAISPAPPSPLLQRRQAAEAVLLLDTLGKLVRLGIEEPPLRDEIYCQLCKQLTGHRGPPSAVARGWVLLASCLGAFGPSRSLLPHLEAYVLAYGVHGYDAYCYARLRRHRTLTRARWEVPSKLEIAAVLVSHPPVQSTHAHKIEAETRTQERVRD